SAEAATCVSELLDLLRERPSFPSFWVMDVAVVLAELGRGDELAAAVERAPATRWLEAASAYLAAEPGQAADLCDVIGALPEAGRAALAAGRRRDAENQLSRALEFYRQVDATSHCRRAEELLSRSMVPGV